VNEKLKQLFAAEDLNFACTYQSCQSRCCKNDGRRFVLLSDLTRLIQAGLEKYVHGKYPSAEVAQNLLSRPNDIDYYREHYVMPYLENKNHQCVFLNSDYSCQIYENRPSVCRVYPFSIQTQLQKAQISTRANKLCPSNAKGPVDEKFLEQMAIDLTKDAKAIKETLSLLAFQREALTQRGFSPWL